MRTIIVSVVLIACFSLAASQPTYCWTCPSGWAHWWDFGYSQPTNGDQCQCMKGTPATTTKAPTTTTTRSPTVAPSSPSTTPNCWTCPSGYTHWWVMGFTSAPGGDQCACVWGTTNAPATTTTNAPSPSTATPSSTPSCWTCPSGWAHWWTMGYTSAPGGDKCACVLGTATTTNAATTTTNAPTASNGATTTTNAPSSTPYCWTCPSGWAHWWTMGYTSAPGGDQCACVQGTATTTNAATTTTRAPTTTTTTKAATTTTSAPATTTTQTPMSTPYCWTCPSGYSHWWEFGYSAPPGGDKCECIKGNAGPTTTSAATTTTKAATTTTNAPTPSTVTPSSTPSCWTCPSGWSHWWTMGYTSAPSGDQCACVQGSSGSTPTTTTRTPSAPTAAPSNALQKFINLLTPNSNSPGSVSFSPYIAPYSPWNGPPMDLIDQLGSVLAKTTGFRTVMIYYTEPYLVGSCVRNGMNVFGIISLNADANNNEYVINLAIDTARKYPNNVIGLACGNELGMQLGVTYNTAAIINNCITRIKAANLGIPVGVTDTYSSWTANGVWSAVSNNADFIGANIYAWYNNMYIPPPFTCETPDNGPQNTYNQFVKVQSMYPNIPVVLSEFGWPSCGAGYNCVSPNVVDGSTCAKANDANQKKFVQSVVDIFRKNSKPCNTFAAFREAWKGTNSADINEYWGVCSASAPYSCFNAPV